MQNTFNRVLVGYLSKGLTENDTAMLNDVAREVTGERVRLEHIRSIKVLPLSVYGIHVFTK